MTDGCNQTAASKLGFLRALRHCQAGAWKILARQRDAEVGGSWALGPGMCLLLPGQVPRPGCNGPVTRSSGKL